MATKVTTRMVAARYLPTRRFSSGGKILSEEEKAAENVYIKKIEQEKLEKLARKGPKPEETAAAGGSGGSVTDAKPSSSASASGASTEKVSTDNYKNYAVVAGLITVVGAFGWYKFSGEKKQEVQQ